MNQANIEVLATTAFYLRNEHDDDESADAIMLAVRELCYLRERNAVLEGKPVPFVSQCRASKGAGMSRLTDEQVRRLWHKVMREGIGRGLQIDACLTELLELRAVVGKLPKTADGVPIMPGMKLWGSLRWNDEPGTATLRGTFSEGYSVLVPEWGMNVRPEIETWSTKEAALAAKEPQ